MSTSTGSISATTWPQMQSTTTGTDLYFIFNLCGSCTIGSNWNDGVMVEFIGIENWMAIRNSELNSHTTDS